MIERAVVIAEARTWLGTPFVHQGRLRGVGCDCAGLIAGVAIGVGAISPEQWAEQFEPFDGYARQPSGDLLARVCDLFMVRIKPAYAMPGDVLLMAFRHDPQHLGFLTTPATMLHALGGVTVREVVEHRLDPRWQSRVRHAYRLPGVA